MVKFMLEVMNDIVVIMRSYACYDFVITYFVQNYEMHARKYVVKRRISLHIVV